MNAGHHVKRPKPEWEEDEDDLLALQNQFLKDKQTPAAQVVRSGPKKREVTVDDGDVDKQQKIKDNHDIPMVMDINIVERDVSSIRNCLAPNVTAMQSFPKPVKFLPNSSSKGRQGQSLFAKHFAVKKSNSDRVDVDCHFKTSLIDGSGLGQGGKYEVDQIRKENLDTILSLTPEELEEARMQILSSLKAENISFLKHKSKETCSLSQPSTSDVEMSDVTNDDIPLGNVPVVKEAQENKWINMDKIERSKLKWMTPLDEKSLPTLNREARFDFDGNLVTNDDQLTGREGLHHHGKEPDRGGYTLSELMTFVESSLPGQKIIGLTILGKVMTRSYRGVYDGCFTTSLAQQLLESTTILLSIRRCLDDTNSTVFSAALSSMVGLLCNLELDEMYLDRLLIWNLGLYQLPRLDLDPLEEVVAETPDETLICMDPIRGLIRTNILQRLAYLLNHQIKEKDDHVLVKNVIRILIRFARHSHEVRRAVYSSKNLMESLMVNFLQPSIISDNQSFYGNPYSKVLKLIRLLSDVWSTQPMDYTRQLLSSCQVYITLDPSTISPSPSITPSNVLELSIESLRTFCCFLQDGSSDLKQQVTSSVATMIPIFVKQCQYMLTLDIRKSDNAFDWQFSSTLLTLLRLVHKVNPSMSGIFRPIISSVILTWMTTLMRESIIPDSVDVSSCLSAGVHYLLQTGQSSRNQELKDHLMYPLLSSEKGKHLWSMMVKKLILQSSLKSRKKSCRTKTAYHVNHEDNRNQSSSKNRRSSRIHPDFGSLEEEAGGADPKINQILANDGILPLAQSIIQMLAQLSSSGGDDNDAGLLVVEEDLTNFLSLINQGLCSRHGVISSIFDYHELVLVVQIILLLTRTCRSRDCGHPTEAGVDVVRSARKSPEEWPLIWWELSLKILTLIPDAEMRCQVQDGVIFNNRFLVHKTASSSSTSSILSPCTYPTMEEQEERWLQLVDRVLRISESESPSSIDNSKVVTRLPQDKKSLPSCRLAEKVDHLKTVYSGIRHDDDRLPVGNSIYWIFHPIVSRVKVAPSQHDNQSLGQSVDWESLELCLEFVKLIWRLLPNLFSGINCGNSSVESLIMISAIYLTGSRYYLEEGVKSHLNDFLNYFLSSSSSSSSSPSIDSDSDSELNPQLSLPPPIIHALRSSRATSSPTTTTRTDKELTLGSFFKYLLREYESESYSDSTFTSYLLYFVSLWRGLLFEDEEDVLDSVVRVMRTNDVVSFDARLLKRLLYPLETNANIIESMTKCLLGGSISPDKNPILYAMSIHHVHHFLTKMDEDGDGDSHLTPFKRRLIKSIESSSNDRLKKDVIHYQELPARSAT